MLTKLSQKEMRPNIDLDIIENPLEWLRTYQQEFLMNYKITGQLDWGKYKSPVNSFSPGTEGINLSKSRLLFISIAGAYIRGEQKDFNTKNYLGDYSIRLIHINTCQEKIRFSSSLFDLKNNNVDSQILFPLPYLKKITKEGQIGALAPLVVSMSRYQPDVIRVVKEVVPAILRVAKEYSTQAVYILPVDLLCIQSAGLVARALEVNGIATTLTSWDAEIIDKIAPPRTYITRNSPDLSMQGSKVLANHQKVLRATLALLSKKSPIKLFRDVDG